MSVLAKTGKGLKPSKATLSSVASVAPVVLKKKPVKSATATATLAATEDDSEVVVPKGGKKFWSPAPGPTPIPEPVHMPLFGRQSPLIPILVKAARNAEVVTLYVNDDAYDGRVVKVSSDRYVMLSDVVYTNFVSTEVLGVLDSAEKKCADVAPEKCDLVPIKFSSKLPFTALLSEFSEYEGVPLSIQVADGFYEGLLSSYDPLTGLVCLEHSSGVQLIDQAKIAAIYISNCSFDQLSAEGEEEEVSVGEEEE
jgi:hypothetical protein